MEEPDLEEGEACYYKDDASIDPDIALSYIDEKLQNVLGHFQKDFEGGVSKDNLGAKFGGYGSFLPTYQRSPPAKSQPKTPQMTQSYSTPRSPNNLHVEGAPQNHMAPSEVPLPLKIGTVSSNKQSLSIPKVASADVSAKKEIGFLSAQVADKLPWKHEPASSKSVNPPDQRTLKVRIKVGSDNTAKKNAAIYSGLGLISPSSSTENSQEDSDGVLFDSQHIPDEYPSSILQGLTAYPVGGGLLLSPLQERLLYLRRKENISLESKPALSFKGRQNDEFIFKDDPASMPRAAKVSKGKKTNSAGKFEALEESKHGNGIDFEDKMDYPLKKTMIPDTLESKKCFPHDTRPKLLPGSINDTHDSLKVAIRGPEACMENGVLVKKREVNKKWGNDKLLSTDLVKEESSESMYGRNSGKYVQQEAKSSSAEKIREHVVRSSSKDVPLDIREGGKSKVNRVPAPSKAHSDVSKSEKDPSIGAAAHIEQKVGSKVTPQEQDGPKIPPSKNILSLGVKKKPKGIQSIDKSGSDLIEESLRSHVRTAPKEKKSSQKNAHKVRESYDDVLDIRSEQKANQLGRPSGDRAKKYKLEAVQEKEALNNVYPATQGVNAEMELGSVAPVVIEEDWVCCDRCQKWRLLPYGTKPEQLPENWWCSMLNWLPGMNHCDISEEETTKALHALYQLPPPETQNNLESNAGRTAPGVASADVMHFDHNRQTLGSDAMSYRGKKKHKSKETPNTASNSGMVQASNFIKKSREEMVERRSLDEMDHHLLETNVMKKSNAQHLSQSGNLAVERHCHELKEKHPSGGDLKQKKLKSKRAPDDSGYETTKKIKTEATVDTDKYGKDLQKHSGPCDLKDPKLEPKERVLISVKKQRDCTQVSGGSGPMDLKTSEGNKLYAKKRKLKDWQESQNQHLETLRSNGNHLPENKVSLKEEKIDSETRKEKKSRVSRTLEESITKDGDDRTNKTVTRIILPASRVNPADKSVKRDQQHRAKVLPTPTMEDIDFLRRDLGSEQFSMGAASSSSKVSDSRKRACLQEVKGSPVESVSSSPMRTSKLSPTRRGNSGQDDVQNGGFPVMGSPRKSLDRLGTLERNRSGASAKGEAPGALPPDSVGLSLPDFLDTDARRKSGAKAESGTKPSSVFENSHLVNSDADTLEQHHERVNTKHRNIPTSSHKSGKASALRVSKDKDGSIGYNFQKVTVKASDPSGGQDLNPKKILNEAQSGQHQLAPHQPNAKHQVSDECSIKSSKDEMTFDKKGSRKRATESRRESLTKTREQDGSDAKLGELTLEQQLIRDFGGESETKRDPIHQVESRSGKSRFNPRHVGKQEISAAHIPQPLSGNLKGSGCDVRAADADVLEGLKQPGKAVDPNRIHNSVGNPASFRGVVGDLSSTLKRDTSTATSALKEAEGLKAYADTLKESAFHFECNEANFQAALMFLHGASLLETRNGESSKDAETSPIQVYSSAAKLCEMCGQEYEKRLEMAAAALAYKCMEVAYMRIVYCKSSSTNRDRHDLQASLLMVPQGESPSSSASDIDNLNNQATLDKTALSRGITSHAGNHVIVARNRPNFVRLLDFTNDVNSAMEASRKSSNAFAAANVILEEAQNKEGIVCVKRVIDFSFQDVEEFIRLVRHVSGAISCQGFSSNRD